MKDVTRDLLIQKSEYYKEMAEMCDKALNGESIAQVCRDHNVSMASFRGRLFKNDDKSRMVQPEVLMGSMDEFLSPYEKIFNDVLKSPMVNLGPYSVYNHPQDFEQTIDNLIDELPDERMKTIIQRFYFEGKTLTQIGEELGLSSSRVSQINHRAIWTMCRNNNILRLIFGDTRFNQIIDAYKDRDFNLRILDSISWAMLHRTDVDALCETIIERINRLKRVYHQEETILKEASIEELNLDTRTFNSLMRSGQDWTIQKIDNMTDKELLRVRNLGIGCIQELRCKIAEYKKSLESQQVTT